MKEFSPQSLELPPHDLDVEYKADILLMLQSIDIGKVRVQELEGSHKKNLMWGVMTMEDLPFIFVASSALKARQLTIPNTHISTHWWPHRPYRPEQFHKPLFTDSLSSEEKEAIELMKKGIDTDKRYEAFYQKYDSSKSLRAQFDAAVSLACNEKEGGHSQENTTLTVFTRIRSLLPHRA